MPKLVECSHCGDPVKIPPSSEQFENHYCSQECMGLDRVTKVKLSCENCGKDIYKQPSSISPHNNHFCSTKCHDGFRRNGVEVECANCGDSVYRTPSEQREKSFCSRQCQIDHREGENHPLWNSEKVRCWWCGEESDRCESRREYHKRQFCNVECHGNWKSWNNIHPLDTEPDKDVPKWAWDDYLENASDPPDIAELERKFERGVS